jgi:ABC-type phosphate transport system ATPase subunit
MDYNNHLVTPDYLREVRRHIGIVFQNPENQFVGSIVEYRVQKLHHIPQLNLQIDFLDFERQYQYGV